MRQYRQRMWWLGLVGCLMALALLVVGATRPALTAAQTALAPVPAGTYPYIVGIDTGLNRAYVAVGGADKRVTVVDLATNTVLTTIPISGSPFSIAVDSTAHRAYISNNGDKTVSVLDTQNNTVVATLTLPSYGYTIAVDEVNHRVYLPNYSASTTVPSTVSVIDTSTIPPTVLDTDGNAGNGITAIPVGTQPYGTTIHPTTHHLYVTSLGGGTITEIDPTTNTVVRTITVPNGGVMRAVVIDPATNYLYVTSTVTVPTVSNTVKVLDLNNNNALVKTLIVGATSWGITFDPDTHRVYVADFGGGTVTIIDTTTNMVAGAVNVGYSPRGIFVDPNSHRVLVPLYAASGSLAIVSAPHSLSQVQAASGTYGGNVTLSASIVKNDADDPRDLSGTTVQFSLNGTVVCGGGGQPICPKTNASGVATFTVALGTLVPGTYTNAVKALVQNSLDTASASVTNDLTVTPAPLTITAPSVSRAYGAPNPTFTLTYSGLVNAETPDNLTAQPTCITAATQSSSVGTYPITCSGATSSNYTISYVDGNVAVTNAVVLTITAPDANRGYGEPNPTFTPTYSGFVNNDTPQSLTALPVCTTTATQSSPAGSYPLTCTGATSGNYTISYSGGTLTIAPVPLTISAPDASRDYGETNPVLVPSATGLTNGDILANFPATPDCTTAAVPGSTVGSYTISCSGAVNPNYVISYSAGTLTVNNGAQLTITAPNVSRPYGSTSSLTFTPTYQGWVNNDGPSSLSPAPTCTTTATKTSPVGSYPITCTGAGNPNYTLTYSDAVLTIDPVPLTITAPSTGRAGGVANPTFTPSYQGFVNGDTPGSLQPAPTCTSTATISSPQGDYPILCSGADTNATQHNYTISYVAGTLNVQVSSLTLTVQAAGTGNGTVTPGIGTHSYTQGAVATLTATAAPGSRFVGWVVDGTSTDSAIVLQRDGWFNPNLTLTMGAAHTVSAKFLPDPTFCDVTSSTTYQTAIQELAARKIILGYTDGCYGPTNAVERAQVAAFIVRAFDWQQQASANAFTDQGSTPDELWHAIGILTQKGIAQGYGNGIFKPTDPVLHAQVISFITRSLVAAGYWKQQPMNTTVYGGLLSTNPHGQDISTYLHYVPAGIPGAEPTQAWTGPTGWSSVATRGWTAQVFWAALESHFNVDRVP